MDITSFSGRFYWLSNFSAAIVTLDGVSYPTVENAYQAAKVPATQRAYFTKCSPARSKTLSRQLGIRPDWEQIKVQVMHDLLVQKFAYGSLLAARLVATMPGQLIEGNTWNDTFWGVCNGKGKNQLGILLMNIRQRLAESPSCDT